MAAATTSPSPSSSSSTSSVSSFFQKFSKEVPNGIAEMKHEFNDLDAKYRGLNDRNRKQRQVLAQCHHRGDVWCKHFKEATRADALNRGKISQLRILIHDQTVQICEQLHYEFLTSTPPPSVTVVKETKSDEKKPSDVIATVSSTITSSVATAATSSSSATTSTTTTAVRLVKVVLDRTYVTEAASRTIVYPNAPLLNDIPPCTQQVVTVYSGDCIDCARQLQLQGLKPFVLNMANQSTPGGGWEGGAGAQEENLFRRTTYSLSLRGDGYPLTDTGAAYSPNVIVFRSNEAMGYELLEEPFALGFVACAAYRGPTVDGRNRMIPKYAEGTKAKIRTILAAGLANGHDCAVLSALGCGAYRNPPGHMAELFREVIAEYPQYRHIAFAIFDDHNANKTHNPDGNLLPFQRVFAPTKA